MQRQAPIGFVVLSHRGPDQLLRLVRTLGRMYGDPPIVCHHDFGQTPLDPGRFPSNLRFVEQWNRTGWGQWSVVDAFLRSLALLYADGGPEWFALLSGVDYPVASAETVLAELSGAGCDAFLDAHQLAPAPAAATLTGSYNPQLCHQEEPQNRADKWRFYLARQFWIPIIRRDPHWRLGRHTVRLPFEHRGMFSQRFSLWWGDHWFTGNRRVAKVLLQPTAEHRRLQRYLRWKNSVDECYYQTVLCNTPGLVINRDNKRFAEWNGGGSHPIMLGVHEAQRALASGAHFARKFDEDGAALDAIDMALQADATGEERHLG